MLIFLWSFLIIIGFNQNVCQAEDRPHIIFFLADDLGKLMTTYIIHASLFIESCSSDPTTNLKTTHLELS